MTFDQKETSLLKDLRDAETLCAEKYGRYAAQACDGELKNLFTQIGQHERQHLATLDQLSSGALPQMGGGSQIPQPSAPGSCAGEQKKQDAFLCSDALAMEKHVSAEYNTCIFEFRDPAVRNILNHIQKEEQQHGERVWQYMSLNGMYG